MYLKIDMSHGNISHKSILSQITVVAPITSIYFKFSFRNVLTAYSSPFHRLTEDLESVSANPSHNKSSIPSTRRYNPVEQSLFQAFKNPHNPQCMCQCILAKPKQKMEDGVGSSLAFPFIFSGIFDLKLRLEKPIDSSILVVENPIFHLKKKTRHLNLETVKGMERSSHFDLLRKTFVEDKN